jgi:hypothetical protein
MPSSSGESPVPLHGLEADAAVRAILEGTATETGRGCFAALVQNLAEALGTHGAWGTEYFPERRRHDRSDRPCVLDRRRTSPPSL